MEATPGQANVHPTVPSDRGIAVPIVPWHPEVLQSFHEFPEFFTGSTKTVGFVPSTVSHSYGL